MPTWEAIAEVVNAAIVIVDAGAEHQPITYVNAEFSRMTGYSREEAIGRNCRFLQGDDRDQPARHELAQALRAGRSCRVLLRNYRRSGELFWNDLHVSPLMDSDGTVTQFVGVQHDVTERVRTRDLLARSREALKGFSSVVAHDLLSPIATQKSNMNIVRDFFIANGEHEALPFIDAAVRACDRMSSLVVGMQRSATGSECEFQPVPVSLASVAGEVLDDLREPIRSAGAEVRIHSLPGVLGDAYQLRQVLQNLVENALKYRGAEPCRIEVGADVQEGIAEIWVLDNGMGIPSDSLESVFEVHVRLDRDRRAAGSGLGLATCRRIVERHGGRIHVESAPGQGARFSFSLPTHDCSEHHGVASERSETPSSL